jgi:hypothetical protein
VPPPPLSPVPRRRRPPRHRRGRHPQEGPARPDAGRVRAGQPRRRRVHQNRFCAAPVHALPRAPGRRQRHRALVVNTGIANAGTGEPGMRAARATCAAVARCWAAGRAGAAVFHRRDHGIRCRSIASKPACPRRRPTWPPTTGMRRRRHHDHRHLPKAASRRSIGGKHRHRHRHQQGRRHDPAQHGDHARLRRHRCR